MTKTPSVLDPLQVPLVGTFLVEASAGTGKTHTISTLYLRLLLERELTVDQVLVVTFTNAATAELRDRLRARVAVLLKALEGHDVADPEVAALADMRADSVQRQRDCARLRAALYAFDLAPVHTIHSFCQRMLQQYAFEGGRVFEADIALDADRWIARAVEAYWLSCIEQPADLEPLLEPNEDGAQSIPSLLDGGARKCLEDLARLVLRYPELQIQWPQGKDPRVRAWRKFLREGVERVRAAVAKERARRRQRSFDDLVQELREALRAPTGDQLARFIRQQLPAALIDEFQDTDPVQYEIFQRVYGGQNGCSLFLIGDPKQAIYAFRGADVFAYLRGKRDAQCHYTLARNYRSAPNLVRAINVLFSQQTQPFLIDGIDFYPVQSALPEIPEAALEIVWLPLEGNRSLTKDWGERELPRRVAADIARFVARAPQFEGQPVKYSDVAVLCRSNQQAAAMQRALRGLGIPSALESEFSVFDTPEAMELELVLAAMLQPTSHGRVGAALATLLMGLDAAELVAVEENDSAWDEWSQRFYTWGEIWRRSGILRALQQLFDDQQVLQRELERIDGERVLTNLRHLGELLHQAAAEHRLAPEELLQWLGVMRREKELRSSDLGLGEAAQLRLESDERAVKIVTIHKSKGLQYPVVFCPFVWDQPSSNRSKLLLYHHPQRYDLRVAVPPIENEAASGQAELEDRAEARRLLYVALTRARYYCVAYWGSFASIRKSPLFGLIHPELEAERDTASRGRKKKTDLTDEDIQRALERLEERSQGAIRARRWQSPAKTERPLETSSSGDQLSHRDTVRCFDEIRWQVASFSSLVHKAEELPPLAREGFDHDPVPVAIADREIPPDPRLAFWRTLPAGARTGEWLHAVLEHLDFAHPIAEQRGLLERVVERQGLSLSLTDLERTLQAVVDTPLCDGLRLRDVDRARRVNEMGFVLPAALSGATRPRGIEPADVAAALAAKGSNDFVRRYAMRVAKLPFRSWQGFLKGYIDLVFEHGGRWYVVDYKSNDLGPGIRDYGSERLALAMEQHHYVLQYHLYVVALDRFLQRWLTDYDYEQHFGGVFYLFLRGMDPGNPPGTGVFFDRPSRELIDALSNLFRHGGDR